MARCVECGFLGVIHAETRRLVPPSEHQRETGENALKPSAVGSGEPITEQIPTCALGAMTLSNEIEPITGAGNSFQFRRAVARQAVAIMHKERTCPKFRERIPGLFPKEHVEMLLTQDMLNAQASAAKAQAERERRWRQEDLSRAAAERAADIKRTKWDIAVKVIGPVVGAIVGASIGWYFRH
jgi:hypothetical protein